MLTNTKPVIKHNKINLSIPHLLNPKLHHTQTPLTQEQPFSDVLLTPLRFEEMYCLMCTKMKKKPIIFDSKNVTPIQSRHHSRNASLKKSKKSYTSTRYHQKVKQQQANPKISVMTNQVKQYEQEKTKNIDPIPPFIPQIDPNTPPQLDSLKILMAQKREQFCHKLKQLLQDTNHHQHNHIRNKECFLAADEIREIIGKMGYNTNSGKYQDLLEQLQCEKYDGVPSQNIRTYLLIIQGIDGKQIRVSHHQEGQVKMLPKSIINRSLEIFITDHEKQWIFEYFRNWSLSSTSSFDPQIKETHYHPPSINHVQETNSQPQVQNCQLDTFTQTSNILQELKNNKQNTINNFGLDENEKHQEILKLKSKINEALQFSRSLMETKENITTADSIEKKKKPILSVNVNLGNNINENIVVYEGESPKQVCERLSSKFTLSQQTKNKFQKMLSNHLKNMLWKISELSEELLTENQ